MNHQYLNLAARAPRRLATLKRAADLLNANPHNARRNTGSDAPYNPYTWRDVRHSSYASSTNLDQGFNSGAPVWYTHDGPQFPREQYADEVEGARIDHKGWFADTFGDRTVRGLVVALPHGRFLAGYEESDNGERVYYAEIHDDATDAANTADGLAERVAEDQRESDERYQAARELEDNLETTLDRLRECLALRNNPCFTRLRHEAHELVERVREMRHELATDYAGVL